MCIVQMIVVFCWLPACVWEKNAVVKLLISLYILLFEGKNTFSVNALKRSIDTNCLTPVLSCSCRMRSTTSCTSGTGILCDLKSMKYWKQQTSLLSLSLSIKENIRWLIKVVVLLFLSAWCHLRKFWFSYCTVILSDCNTSTFGLYYLSFFFFF